MKTKSHYIDYEKIGSFSKLMVDYLHGNLDPSFFNYTFSYSSVMAAVEARRTFPCNRSLLVTQMEQDYSGMDISEATKANIQLLASENTFTVCTAHQPNIFTGHLYFVYKILHAVQMAKDLNEKMKDLHFVPVYYMGSEDADLDELGKIKVLGQTYQWQTDQQGAVGRMIIDDLLIAIIDNLELQLGSEESGKELISMLRRYYTKGSSVEKATFGLVNELFGKYGLVVMLPDRASYKRSFIAEFEKEISLHASHHALSETMEVFPEEYKIQASGRDINLFMLDGAVRDRVEPDAKGIRLAGSGLLLDEAQWKNELQRDPRKFSPNVILRPVFQEKLLPNIAFIGGGSEISYWLELKKVFEVFHVHFPILVLRNSFLLIDNKAQQRMAALEIDAPRLFQPVHQLEADIVRSHTSHPADLSAEKQKLNDLYDQIREAAALVDRSLSGSADALRAKALDSLEQIEKKMLKAEKLKNETEIRQLHKLLELLFPEGKLQERVENILPFFAIYGKLIIDQLLEHSKSFDQQFCVLEFS